MPDIPEPNSPVLHQALQSVIFRQILSEHGEELEATREELSETGLGPVPCWILL